MRTIYTYITKQILATLGITFSVFTFVLILGNVLKEIVTLLVSGKASLFIVIKALGLLLPYVLVFALPIALLTAVLLFFGRLSADQELTAIRSSGISLIPITLPVLIISMLCSILCAWINLWLGPACRSAYKDWVKSINIQTTANLITEESFITQIPGYWIYIGKRDGNYIEEVRIFTLKEGEVDREYNAKTGRLDINEEARLLQITLYDTIVMFRVEQSDKRYSWQWADLPGEWSSSPIHIQPFAQHSKKPKISNMTFLQLKNERWLRQNAIINSQHYDRNKHIKSTDMITPIDVQLHRQIAFSFACFSFTLVGIPLGIRSHRRETSIGVAFALILLALYYTFFIIAQSLDHKPQYHPQLILWLPNFMFQAIGSYMIWKADRCI